MLVLVAIATPWTLIPGDNADGAGMRSHLHAIFEARELLYDDDYAQLGMSPLFAFVTSEGLVSNHWPVGASFLQAPGWLLGRGAGAVLHGAASVNISERAATWDIPLLGLRSWALLVLVLGLGGIARWLIPRVGARTTGLTVGALLLGTPLLYYAAEAPERPHLWGFCVVALLLVRWFDAVELARAEPERARASLRAPVELAVYAGLATAIRPQLAMLALLVAHERLTASHGLDPRARIAFIVRHGLVCAGVFAVWPMLVVGMQHWMYGGLSDYQGEVTVHLRAFLLSTHHGALVWCPVLVIGALGVAIGVARRESGAALVVLLLAAQIWLDAGTREIEPYSVLGTRTWTGGTSFGPRKLLDAVPLLIPGVVWVHRWLADQSATERARWQRRLATAAGLAVVPTVLLLAAAWLDPQVCSTVLDGDRLVDAMGLAFDPSNWRRMWTIRELPGPVRGWVAVLVALPLALVVAAVLMVPTTTSPTTTSPSTTTSPRARRWLWALTLGYGLVANAWLFGLQRRTEALIVEQPERIERARARLDPIHEAMVRAIPAQQALLSARLGPGH